MPAPKLMTVEQYFRTLESPLPMELAFGVLRVADAPTPRHQSAVAQLFRALDAHVRERGLGQVWFSPLDVVLDERKGLIVQPDLLFISSAREWIVQDRVRGAPDLVVEVLSPNPRVGRTEEKVRWFAEHGVRECWLVHQVRRDITVLEYDEHVVRSRTVFRRDVRVRSLVLPEFARTFDEMLD
jgi:Uma2 family endonuclease